MIFQPLTSKTGRKNEQWLKSKYEHPEFTCVAGAHHAKQRSWPLENRGLRYYGLKDAEAQRGGRAGAYGWGICTGRRGEGAPDTLTTYASARMLSLKPKTELKKTLFILTTAHLVKALCNVSNLTMLIKVIQQSKHSRLTNSHGPIPG